MTGQARFLNGLLAALALGLSLATCAGRPAVPSGAFTGVISSHEATRQDALSATARSIGAGHWEMRLLKGSHDPMPALHSGLPGLPVSSAHRTPTHHSFHAARASGVSCATPGPGEAAQCRELERQILASTVRIEWHAWTINPKTRYGPLDGGIGYATIKKGRYLVTHNHPGVPLSQPQEGTFITISVFDAHGHPVWMAAPMSTVTIVAQEAETVMLDFGAFGGDGLFAMLGLQSAKFATWETLPLQPGVEVAQIDWDGAQAHVEWTTVDALATAGGTPRLELANSVASGASGGGVFWNGHHIANTWFRATEYGRNDIVVREYDVAALNSAQIASE